jgi:hypothetical protein
MHGCQNWQCSAGDPPESTAKKYKKTTYKKIQNDGVQVENPGTTTLRKILLLHTDTDTVIQVYESYTHSYTLAKGLLFNTSFVSYGTSIDDWAS